MRARAMKLSAKKCLSVLSESLPAKREIVVIRLVEIHCAPVFFIGSVGV